MNTGFKDYIKKKKKRKKNTIIKRLKIKLETKRLVQQKIFYI